MHFWCYFSWQVLVRYHVSINDKNCRGNTALHLAAAHHHPKIVELLLSVGANPFTENDDRAKPVELVPESDSVTRQLLKSAMANPRPAPLDASMLSLRRDLHDLSMMPGITVPQMLAPKPAPAVAIPNGLPPALEAGPAAGANRSFKTMSSTSSVFMDDTKARLGALQLPRHDQAQNNAIPLYTPVDKRHQLNTSRHGGHGSQQASLDRSVVPPSPARGDTKRRSGRGKATSASASSPLNQPESGTVRSARAKVAADNHELDASRTAERKNRSSNGQRGSRTSVQAPAADRSSKKHHPLYENVSFDG